MGFINQLITGGHHPVYIYIYMQYRLRFSSPRAEAMNPLSLFMKKDEKDQNMPIQRVAGGTLRLKLTAPQCHRTLKTKRMLPMAWKNSRSRCYDGIHGYEWTFMDMNGSIHWWLYLANLAASTLPSCEAQMNPSQSPHGLESSGSVR